MTNVKTTLSRRTLIRRAAIATGGLALTPRSWARAQGANEKVVLGVIGTGGMGRSNTKSFMKCKGLEVGALCDVDTGMLGKALQDVAKDTNTPGRPVPEQFKDFRKLLERKDLDAVLIATPDHWHAMPLVAAVEAGKDVYLEKPISHSFTEAKIMAAAAKHHKRVVQVGTWQRSVPHFQKAIEFVRSGKMGEVNVCRAWFVNPMGGWLKSIGHEAPGAAPPELDWDMWLGPAPKVGYAKNRCHFGWRWFFDYGGGLMTDWGVHMIDIVLQGMQDTDPVSVSSVGGKLVLDDDRDTPDTMLTIYKFGKWVLHWEVRFNNGRGLDGGRNHGSEFIGTNGSLVVDRTDYQWFGEKPEHAGPPKAEKADATHWQNFLDCVKSREKPRSDIESMAKTTIVCHLGNIAYRTGKTITWDPKKQDVTGPTAADARKCLSYERPYRAPWKLKKYV